MTSGNTFQIAALQAGDAVLPLGSLLGMTKNRQREALDEWVAGDDKRIQLLCRQAAKLVEQIRKIKEKTPERGALVSVEAALTDYLVDKYKLDEPNVIRVGTDTVTASFIAKIPKREIVRPFSKYPLFELGRRIFGERRLLFAWGDPYDTVPAYKTAADGKSETYKQYNNFLMFVEVALVEDIPPTVQHILDGTEVRTGKKPKIAMYYSINSNTPDYSFKGHGERFILSVAPRVAQEHPEIERHVTYSPMPTFRNWINNKDEFTQDVLNRAFDACRAWHRPNINEFKEWLLSANSIADLEMRPDYYKALRALGNMYVLGGKFDGEEFKANDGVSRFHVGNGAVVIQVKTGADLSDKGFKESFGLMAHYEYVPDKVAANQQLYAKGQIVATADVRAEIGALPRQRIVHAGLVVARTGADAAMTGFQWLTQAISGFKGKTNGNGTCRLPQNPEP